MTSNKFYFFSMLIFSSFVFGAIQGCGKTSSPNVLGSCAETAFTGTAFPAVGAWSSGQNVVPVAVNDPAVTFGHVGNAYLNEPTVSVTICSPNNPSVCQTINHILLDTGSFGLRIYSSLVTVPLLPVSNGDKSLAECVQFGDGSSEWGPVDYAYVQLATEPKGVVPIMLIDSGYLNPPGPCTSAQSTPDTSPSSTGYNGILGVGLFAEDCGSYCSLHFDNGSYYTCENGNCTCGATADSLAQVTNPVSVIPTDRNGLILKFPSAVPNGGVASTTGSLVLGIDTQANNSSSGKTAYQTNGNGEILTVFGAYSSNTQMCSFIDSGSSILYFPTPQVSPFLPDCGNSNSSYAGIYCPANPVTFTGAVPPTSSSGATNYDTSGNHANAVTFTIENGIAAFQSSHHVYATVGGETGSCPNPNDGSVSFDYGLPFFFGKSVYVGFQNKSSNIGIGPYWSY